VKSLGRKGDANGIDTNESIACPQDISIGTKWMDLISRSALFWMTHPERSLLVASSLTSTLRIANWSWIKSSIDIDGFVP
jgi:hypothetical protein